MSCTCLRPKMTDISSADLPDSQIQPPPSKAQLAWVYARTYLIGTWDSFENVLENIANRVGLPLVTPKVSTAPLNGKVGSSSGHAEAQSTQELCGDAAEVAVGPPTFQA